MARYQLTLAYDGTDFFGSQRQAKRRTVQGELEKALCKLGWTGRSVILAGRTDTGVHATGQVAAFDLDWSHSDEELVRALNAALPADIVTGCSVSHCGTRCGNALPGGSGLQSAMQLLQLSQRFFSGSMISLPS